MYIYMFSSLRFFFALLRSVHDIVKYFFFFNFSFHSYIMHFYTKVNESLLDWNVSVRVCVPETFILKLKIFLFLYFKFLSLIASLLMVQDILSFRNVCNRSEGVKIYSSFIVMTCMTIWTNQVFLPCCLSACSSVNVFLFSDLKYAHLLL